MARRDRTQAGFTLIELLVVVAMIAILCAIALPAWWGTTRGTKAEAEVGPYFSDLRSRMEQWHVEMGVYPANLGEANLCPSVPGTTKQDIYACASWPAWQAMRVRLSASNQVHCGFTWVTGLAGDGANVGAEGTAFGFVVPAANWYYLLARCNLDGNAAVDTFAFSSSVDPTIRWRNRGK